VAVELLVNKKVKIVVADIQIILPQACRRVRGSWSYSENEPSTRARLFVSLLKKKYLMKKLHTFIIVFLASICFNTVSAQVNQGQNPIIFADVPDMSMIRVGDSYFMSSTTMHMSPGIPIMKSKDLVNWQIINYAYEVLDTIDALTLKNGKNSYGRGSWASCIRYHNNTYYVSTFAQTTGKTYIFSTKDIEKGPWKEISFKPSYHDNSLFFDDDGRIYLIYGNIKLRIVELNADLSGPIEGTDKVLIENVSEPSGLNSGLGEGSQLFKIKGEFYLFNITWPKGGMRTVVIHRADKITGPWEGKLAFQDLGVAQGGMVDTPQGNWYAYLFRDYGSVGRIPYIIPLKWEDGWPVIGINGKVPDNLDLPASSGLIPGIVASDEFSRSKGDPALPLVWQWNHNPNNELWSVTARKGFLRLTTGRIDTILVSARNTLTQRTIGPVCSGSTCIDVSNMTEGDFAGLTLLQRKFGQVGVRFNNGTKSVVMVNAQSGKPEEVQSVPLNQKTVYLKADCDFREKADIANFYYSLNGKKWTPIGSQLKMEYSMPHFMGYRFGLFNYATKTPGGFVDFDYFNISNQITEKH
jgi:beta-xylosidase